MQLAQSIQLGVGFGVVRVVAVFLLLVALVPVELAVPLPLAVLPLVDLAVHTAIAPAPVTNLKSWAVVLAALRFALIVLRWAEVMRSMDSAQFLATANRCLSQQVALSSSLAASVGGSEHLPSVSLTIHRSNPYAHFT